MTPKLDVNGVSFSYHTLEGETLALSDISFSCLPVNLQPWSARPAAENPPFLFSAVCPNLIRGRSS